MDEELHFNDLNLQKPLINFSRLGRNPLQLSCLVVLNRHCDQVIWAPDLKSQLLSGWTPLLCLNIANGLHTFSSWFEVLIQFVLLPSQDPPKSCNNQVITWICLLALQALIAKPWIAHCLCPSVLHLHVWLISRKLPPHVAVPHPG